MLPEITDKQDWYCVDGNYGMEWIPVDVVGRVEVDPSYMGEVPEFLKDYCANTQVWSIEIVSGYGARLSASGYLDCTEWGVFGTPTEAEEYLEETYPEVYELDEDDS